MKTATLLFQLSIFLLLYLFQPLAKAAEISTMGADINYKFSGLNSLGQQTYEVQLNLYYHCVTDGNISNIPQADLVISSASLGYESIYTLLLKEFNGQEVTPICADSTFTSNCSGGGLPGVIQFTYSNEGFSNLLTLPNKADDWVISFREDARNKQITNLENPTEQGLYIEATINNMVDTPFDSPKFSNLPVPYYCDNLPAVFDLGIISDNNQDLVIKMIQPLSNATTSIPYANTAFSVDNPLAAKSFLFDAANGQLIFTPNAAQYGVVAILIEFYNEENIKLGSVMRDIQLVVSDQCGNEQPIIDGVNDFYAVCPGETLAFTINVTDSQNDSLFIKTHENSTIDTIHHIEASGKGTLSTVFSWTTTNADVGWHTLALVIEDDGCPIYASSLQTIDILVTNDILLEDINYTYCAANQEAIALSIAGCGPFSLQPTPAEVIYDAANQLVGFVPLENVTDYTLTNGSGSSEQLTITFNEGFEVSLESSVEAICKGETANLQVIAENNTTTNYTYTWSDSTLVGANLTISPDTTTSYEVTVMDENGCLVTEELTIIVDDIPALSLATNTTVVATPTQFVTLSADGNFTDIEWSTGENTRVVETTIPKTTTFVATAMSEYGCVAKDSIKVSLDCEAMLPTAFSPNGDGINDKFTIVTSGDELVVFRIFNRWGTEIFSTTDANISWDGYYRSRPQPSGVYVYDIEYKCDGGPGAKRGNFTLLR